MYYSLTCFCLANVNADPSHVDSQKVVEVERETAVNFMVNQFFLHDFSFFILSVLVLSDYFRSFFLGNPFKAYSVIAQSITI